jgi:hypothetical protein
MNRRLTTILLAVTVMIGLSGCVVLDRHGRIDPGATAVANGLLIGAGVIGLGIAAHEADHHVHGHGAVPVYELPRCGRCGVRGHHYCRVHRHWRH